jgi:hypothetical protein
LAAVGGKTIERRRGDTVPNLSTSELRNALGPANEVIDERSDPVSEDDNQYPNDLIVSLIRLFRRTLHDHPNPENRPRDANEQKKKRKAKSDHLTLQFPIAAMSRDHGGSGDLFCHTPLYAARFKKVPWPALPWN